MNLQILQSSYCFRKLRRQVRYVLLKRRLCSLTVRMSTVYECECDYAQSEVVKAHFFCG